MAIIRSSYKYRPTSLRRCATNGRNIYITGEARAEIFFPTVAALKAEAKAAAIAEMESGWLSAYILIDCPSKCRRGCCSWSDWKDGGGGITYTRVQSYPDGRKAVTCRARDVLTHFCDCERVVRHSSRLRSIRQAIVVKRKTARKQIAAMRNAERRRQLGYRNKLKKDLKKLSINLRNEKRKTAG